MYGYIGKIIIHPAVIVINSVLAGLLVGVGITMFSFMLNPLPLLMIPIAVILIIMVGTMISDSKSYSI